MRIGRNGASHREHRMAIAVAGISSQSIEQPFEPTLRAGSSSHKGDPGMDGRSILIQIFISLVAGWLASFVVGGGGLIRYIVIGFIGSFVGAFLFQQLGVRLGIGNPIAEQILISAVGATVVVLIARMIQ
jgi:uncharacterized membrane protein YeaQ/YmgE (transglycosylase-associated protein family)